MTVPRRVVLLGLPNSGKTTYLAALWTLLTGASDPADAELRLSGMPDDFEYLQTINDHLLDLQAQVRTTGRSRPEQCDLSLVSPDGQEVALNAPDIAGEHIARLWESRAWPTTIDRLVSRADGAIVFARADDVVYPHPLEVTAPADSKVTAAAWDPGTSPTQAQLAHMLEVVRYARRDTGRALPLVFAISAWDMVHDDEPDPHQWLEMNLPLIAQFLRSANDMPNKVVGISAQGGDFADDDQVTQIGETTPAETRAWIQDAGHVHHDLTEPLAWIVKALDDLT